MTHLRAVLILSALLSGVACSESTTRCTPGKTIACACSGGAEGTQTCLANQTYDTCECGTVNHAQDMASRTHQSNDMATSHGGGRKRLFVTDTAYSGVAAPSACQSSADSMSLGGTWVPWLSNLPKPSAANPIDNIKGDGPWSLLNGTQAFANHAQLATTPTVEIILTERGNTLDDRSVVWTGTLTGGTASGQSCTNWTDLNATATTGEADVPLWTSSGTESPCNGTARIYCFEQ